MIANFDVRHGNTGGDIQIHKALRVDILGEHLKHIELFLGEELAFSVPLSTSPIIDLRPLEAKKSNRKNFACAPFSGRDRFQNGHACGRSAVFHPFQWHEHLVRK